MMKATAAMGLAALLVAACGDDNKSSDSGSTGVAATDAPAAGGTSVAGTAAGGAASGSAGGSGQGLAVDVSKCTAPTGSTVKLQLQWVTQAQFAGYYAAVDKGYYKDAGLDVQIVEGGVDIPPQKTLASGHAARTGFRHERIALR
jgi:NitT/TauT family transport system substrate-binding protein